MKLALLSFCIYLLALASEVLSSITPRSNQISLTLGPNDLSTVYMTTLFNMQKSKSPYFTVTSPAQIFNYTTPFVSSSLSTFDITVIHQIIDMGNGIIGLLYNNRSMMILPISKDGKRIGTPRVYTDPNIGRDVECDDMILNTVLARVYVSCHSIGATTEEPMASWIYELDFHNASLIQKVTIDQTDGFFVEEASKMRFITVTQGTTSARVLVMYSQSLSGTPGSLNNKWLRYCTGVDAGNLNCAQANVIDFQKTNLNYKAFYDLFPYQSELLLSGLPGTGGPNITLKACYIDIQENEMMCRSTIHSSGVSIGWAGIVNDSRYIEVNMNGTGTVTVCHLNGDFSNPDWMSPCVYNEEVLIYEDSFIRDVELDNSALMIEFVHPNFDYRGYSTHIMFSDVNTIHDDFVGTLAEDRLVYIDPSDYSLNLLWLVPDFVWLNATKMTPGSVSITVTAYDNDTISGISTDIILQVQKDYIGQPEFRSSYDFPEIDILQGSYYHWPVSFFDVTGNALTYNLTFPPNVEGLFEPHIYHTNRIDMNLVSDDPMNQDLRNVVAGDDFVIGIDSNNILVFFSCVYPGVAAAVCHKKAEFGIQQGAILYDKTAKVRGISFVYITTNTGTTFYLFDGDVVGTYTLNGVFPSDVDIFEGMDSNRNPIGVLAYGRNDGKAQGLQIMNFNIYDVNSLSPVMFLDKSNTQDGFLCPSKVNGNNKGFVAVTSVCSTPAFGDTRVVVFAWPGPFPAIEVPLAGGARLVNPEACYFEESLLVTGFDSQTNKSVIYTTHGRIEDPSEEYFGLEEYGLGNVERVYCSEQTNMFTVVAKDAGANTRTFGVFYADSRGIANKRAHSVMKNMNYSRISSFHISHGIVHITYDYSGQPFFWFSFTLGPLIFTDVSTHAPLKLERAPTKKMLGDDIITPTTFSVILTNINGDTTSKSGDFQLRGQDTSINVTSTTKKDLSVGNVDLESMVQITGPVFNARIKNLPQGFSFKERIAYNSSHVRAGGHTYQFIEISGSRTYGVSIESGFTIVDYYQDGEYKSSISGLGFGTFTAFTVVTIDWHNGVDCIFYSMEETHSHQIFGVIFHKGKKISPRFSLNRVQAHKLRGHLADSKTIYLFGKQGPLDLELYVVDISDYNNVNIKFADIVNDVVDFGVAVNNYAEVEAPNPSFFVTVTGFESGKITIYTINIGNPVFGQPNLVSLDHNYRLDTINCRMNTSTVFRCVMNTRASFVEELYWNIKGGFATYKYDKFAYYTGYEVDLAGDYLYMFAKTAKPGVLSMVVLSWKTQARGGTSHLYYALQLPTPSNMVLDIHYTAPFKVIHDQFGLPGDAWIAAATIYQNNPIGFFHTSTFQLGVTDSNADLSQIQLSFEGLSTNTISVDSIFNPKPAPPPEGSSSFWPFAILILVLVGAAIAWFFYTRSKAEAELAGDSAVDGQGYASIKTDKITEPIKTGKAEDL